jgi:hypothetical protein
VVEDDDDEDDDDDDDDEDELFDVLLFLELEAAALV